MTAFLQTALGNAVAEYGPIIEAAYPIGSPGLTNGYDVISQIITEFNFQCVRSLDHAFNDYLTDL